MVKTVDISSENATGGPNSGAEVVIRLVDGGTTSADAPTRLFLDENGEASVDLSVNENGTFYRITVFVQGTFSRQRQIQLLGGTASPIDWDDPSIQVDSRQPPPTPTKVTADDVTVDAAGFDGNLSPTDDTVQKVAQAVDDLVASSTSTLPDIPVASDEGGVFDPDTAYDVAYDVAIQSGFDAGSADQLASSIVAALAGVQPTDLALLVANISHLTTHLSAVAMGALLTTNGKEDAGVAQSIIDGLDLPGTYSLLGHNHFGVYSEVSHNHSGVYDPAGTAAGLFALSGYTFHAADSEAQMLALVDAKLGDWCFRSDLGQSLFVLAGPDPTDLNNWTMIRWGDSDRRPLDERIIDAKGDLLVGTAADAVARLPVGTNRRHTLSPDPSAASGLAWRHIDWRNAPVSGDVVSIQASSSGGTVPITATWLQGHPMWLAAGAIDRIGVYHTANGASTWRLVLYPASATTGRPVGETLLLDAGVIDLSSGAAGWNWKTVSYTIPADGFYWAFVQAVTYTAGPQVHVVQYNSSVTMPMLGVPVDTSSIGRQYIGAILKAPTTDAPATCPATNFAWQSGMPRIFVRYA